MRIDRVVIQGFKSFAERTPFEFGKGVTGVIGPNGSGKSNLVEALRWAVGARARELRSGEAAALLFHGGQERPPMPFAEINIEFSRGLERMGLQRRLERDGNSELRIGSRLSTFKELERVLAGSGLSRGGYAIIGQGEVGDVLQAEPQRLLAYLEEAAGLKGVALAARTAFERLEQAAKELERVALEHLEAQSAWLERSQQAQVAQQARQLSHELLALRRGVVLARQKELRTEAQALQERIRQLDHQRQELQASLAQIAHAKPEAQENQEHALQQVANLKQQAEALGGQLRLLQSQQTNLQSLQQRLARDLNERSQRIARWQSVGQPLAPIHAAPQGDGLEQTLKAAEERLIQERNAFLAQQKAYQNYLQAQAAFAVQEQAYQQALSEQNALRSQIQNLQTDLTQLSSQREAVQQQEAELRQQLQTAQQQASVLASELQAAQKEASRLQSFLDSGSDLAEGPKRIKEARLLGVLGVVADLIEVPSGLEVALEVALGARLQWVLAQDDRAVQAAIDYLKKQGGRATFLALSLLRPTPPKPLQAAGVVGLARDLVRLDAYPQALGALLGNTLVMQDLDSALALLRRQQGWRMVTQEGELIESTGAISGGRLQKQGQMLSLRRRVSELHLEQAQLQERLSQTQLNLDQLQQALAGLPKGLAAEENRLQAELRAVHNSLSRLQLHPPTEPPQVSPPNPTPLESLQQEREALQVALAQQKQLLQEWQRYHQDQQRYQEAQQNLAQEQQRQQEAQGEEFRLQSALADLNPQMQQLQQQMAGLGLNAAQEALEQARQQLRVLAQQESAQLAQQNGVLAALEEARISLARREASLEALEADLAALPPGPAEEGSTRALSRRLQETQDQLDRLGPVNHLAQSESAALQEQVNRLEALQTEAQEVVARLSSELQVVQKEHHSRLKEAFHRFSLRFSDYAEALLAAEARVELQGGGLHLVLRPAGKRTLDLGLLSTGERTMGALAFLFALSAAGQEGGGLPIAVLDEVDAPLDEANILRFTGFLQRFKQETQFVLVTHQKRTMEACDALYGVTSQGGVSRVYSIKKEGA